MVVTRFYVGDFATGQITSPLAAVAGSWSDRLSGQSIDVSLRWSQLCKGSEDAQTNTARTVWRWFLAWEQFLAVTVDGWLVAAGPLLDFDYDESSDLWTMKAQGGEALLAAREICPTAVRDNYWTFYDEPNKKVPAYAQTVLSGSWQDRVRTLLAQTRQWPYTPPFTDPDGSYGSPETETVDAMDHLSILEWLGRMSQAGGPEWSVRPVPSGDTVSWKVAVGSPRLGSTSPVVSWLNGKSATNLRLSRSGAHYASDVTATGGRTEGIQRSGHAHADGVKFTLMRTDSSHSDVDSTALLTSMAANYTYYANKPKMQATFDVPSAGVSGWNVGDRATFRAPGRPDFFDEATVRVMSRSGSLDSDRITVEVEPVWEA